MIHDGEKMLDDGCHLVPGKEWLAHERSFSSLWNKSYTWVTHYHHCSLAHSDIDNAHIVTMDEIDGQVDFPQHNVHGAFALREKLSQVSVMQAIYEVVWRVTWISSDLRPLLWKIFRVVATRIELCRSTSTNMFRAITGEVACVSKLMPVK